MGYKDCVSSQARVVPSAARPRQSRENLEFQSDSRQMNCTYVDKLFQMPKEGVSRC